MLLRARARVPGNYIYQCPVHGGGSVQFGRECFGYELIRVYISIYISVQGTPYV